MPVITASSFLASMAAMAFMMSSANDTSFLLDRLAGIRYSAFNFFDR
jgi:hypothetical protein